MKRLLLSLGVMLLLSQPALSQRKSSRTTTTPTKSKLEETSLSGLKFRNVGPALTSGRIADFAVNPNDSRNYIVATASGGVWKTTNGGVTYTPVFDSQGSYSIGCVTMQDSDPNVVWVGTGENNNQRSVAYGDGVYKSIDGGNSWTHMGLKNSEHIGRIIIDPRDPNTVFVAAIGPLWSAGGDRGVYKTTDGGKTWRAVLTIDENTGVNDVVMDPSNPNVLYAAAFQRRRHVFTYISGGPGSAIYKSTDGGESWEKASAGLPGVDLGRIGLAVTAANPEYVYAIVEAAQDKGGIYRTSNGAANWEKRGSYSTSGNYYQEIIADPVDAEKLYIMDTWMRVSYDGGKSQKVVGEDTKHVDNHCMWIDPAQTSHWLVGCDGGIYETWDAAKTWHFKPNLPVTQFYKVAVDKDKPFYNIYGGTQDNFSLGGPSRSVSGNGISNEEWYITHGGDGFESQIDPENPDIVYSQSQYGFLVRYDRRTGEEVGIQPKPGKDEDAFRFNWDAPLAVSKHKEGRVYFAANKLFRTDDRGNSWQTISPDLSAQIDRNKLKVMGRVWGIDAVSKHGGTSPFGTIVAFSESPVNENLLFVGTDDGLIQITEDGGKNWRKVSGIAGVPNMSYVNALYASQHDENVVYACFNHHKYGDFKPYMYKSSDKGRTWTNISGNLPERGSTYSIEEDHIDPNLIFVGTEFGLFFSNTGGNQWTQLKAGLPTVAIRDIDIQREWNDLVLGSFGRGFFVLDDYSALRSLSDDMLSKDAAVFPVRDAQLFVNAYPLGLPGKSFQGDSYYLGDNLGSVAEFTYYIREGVQTLEEKRHEREAELQKAGKDVYNPTYDELKAEREQQEPFLLFTIKNSKGEVVRQLRSGASGKGVQRIRWDLRYPSQNPISFSQPSFYNPFAGQDEGTLVEPGAYTVTLSRSVDGKLSQLAAPVSFNVKSLGMETLPVADPSAKALFAAEVNDLFRSIQGVSQSLSENRGQLKYYREAAKRIGTDYQGLLDEIDAVENKISEISKKLNGDPLAGTLDIDQPMPVSARVGYVVYESFASTSTPTQTHRDQIAIAREEFKAILTETQQLLEVALPALRKKLEKAGTPYFPGATPTSTFPGGKQ